MDLGLVSLPLQEKRVIFFLQWDSLRKLPIKILSRQVKVCGVQQDIVKRLKKEPTEITIFYCIVMGLKGNI
jgi:hypothetical protein